MKNCLLGALCVLSSVQIASAAERATGDIVQEITKLEKDCNDYYAANDLPKYFACYADDAALIFYNTRTNVPAYHKMWTEATKTEPVEAVKLSDMVISTPATDVAIASYQISVRTHHANSPSTDEAAFETDVWSRKSGTWKMIHVHFSATPTK